MPTAWRAEGQVTLHVEDDTLSIEGEVALPVPEACSRATPRCSCRGTAAVPALEGARRRQVTAELNHGVLKLRIPRPSTRSEEVEIRVG